MLNVKELTFGYRKNTPVLQGASLELAQGQVGILLGKNGCGKTTLFKNILGIEKPSGGTITFENENLLKMNRRDRARRIAYVPQHIHFGDLSVFDSVLMGRVSYFGMQAGRQDYEAVVKILGDMGLADFAGRSAEELSGGEKQLLAIARAVYKKAPIYILDEPTAALSPQNEYALYQKFNEITHGHTVIYISHRLNSCKLANRIILLSEGRIAESGGHAELMAMQGLYYQMFTSQSQYYHSAETSKEGLDDG